MKLVSAGLLLLIMATTMAFVTDVKPTTANDAAARRISAGQVAPQSAIGAHRNF